MELDNYAFVKPAEEIRLLELLEPTDAGQMACRLQRVSIDTPPRFVPVSHVWGAGKPDRRIHVACGTSSKEVCVSKNLEGFLLGLLCHDPETLPQLFDISAEAGTSNDRRRGKRLPMWIDMVCINQADEVEKAAQIPLMRSIYSQAEHVLVWIHEYDSQLRYAFHYIRRALDHAAQAQAQAQAETRRERLAFDPAGWDSICRFLSCEWFQRRWVVQEAALPPRTVFLCGPHVLSLDDLCRGVGLIADALQARPLAIKKIKPANTGSLRPLLALKALGASLRKGGSGAATEAPRLLWLLENLRLTRATLAHDQVYGFLGLCRAEEVPWIPIRYDMPAERLYKECVKTHVRVYNDVEFLALCAPIQREKKVEDQQKDSSAEDSQCEATTTSSWVPNWHSKQLRRCLGLLDLSPSTNFFNAPGAIRPDVSVSGANDNELHVSGVLIDRILTIQDFHICGRKAELRDPNSPLLAQFFDFWTAPDVALSTPYVDEVTRARAIARTLCLLCVFLQPVPRPEEVHLMFYRWSRGSRTARRLEACGFRPEELDAADVAARAAGRASGGRTIVGLRERLVSWRPFITEKGRVGLAREGAEAGDEVWAVGGCSVPVTLSPLGGGRAEVKGEVFLDGFMFGEEMGGPPESLPVERVVLI